MATRRIEPTAIEKYRPYWDGPQPGDLISIEDALALKRKLARAGVTLTEILALPVVLGQLGPTEGIPTVQLMQDGFPPDLGVNLYAQVRVGRTGESAEVNVAGAARACASLGSGSRYGELPVTYQGIRALFSSCGIRADAADVILADDRIGHMVSRVLNGLATPEEY